MANVLLLPGFGGKYTSESIAGGGTGADLIDASHCAQLAFQTTAKSGNSTTVTVSQTFDGTNFATLTTFSTTLATIKLLKTADGPFGILKLTMDGSTGAATFSLVGFPLTTEW